MSIDGGAPSDEMRKIAEAEATKKTSTDVVEVTLATIDQLRATTNAEERQKLLDQLFPNERRERKIAGASKDSQDRPVKYFRKMQYDKLLKMLEQGQQTPVDYYEDINAPVDDEVFRYFLYQVAGDNFNRRELRELSTPDLVTQLFKDKVPADELAKVLETTTYSTMLPFIDKYVPLSRIKELHAGGLSQRFSPLLSMSVGGVIKDKLSPNQIYLEMVMPDEKVIVHDLIEEFEPEKEVFTRSIDLQNVTRVYATTEALQREQVHNPDTAVGKHYNPTNHSSSATDLWRWDEKTEDYLPTSLRKKS